MNARLAAIITWIVKRWLAEDAEYFLCVAARNRRMQIDRELREITETDYRE